MTRVARDVRVETAKVLADATLAGAAAATHVAVTVHVAAVVGTMIVLVVMVMGGGTAETTDRAASGGKTANGDQAHGRNRVENSTIGDVIATEVSVVSNDEAKAAATGRIVKNAGKIPGAETTEGETNVVVLVTTAVLGTAVSALRDVTIVAKTVGTIAEMTVEGVGETTATREGVKNEAVEANLQAGIVSIVEIRVGMGAVMTVEMIVGVSDATIAETIAAKSVRKNASSVRRFLRALISNSCRSASGPSFAACRRTAPIKWRSTFGQQPCWLTSTRT